MTLQDFVIVTSLSFQSHLLSPPHPLHSDHGGFLVLPQIYQRLEQVCHGFGI
jgi:hypothetical protein